MPKAIQNFGPWNDSYVIISELNKLELSVCQSCLWHDMWLTQVTYFMEDAGNIAEAVQTNEISLVGNTEGNT